MATRESHLNIFDRDGQSKLLTRIPPFTPASTLANETLPRAPSNGLPIGNPHVAGDTLHLRVIGLRHDDAFPALRTRDKREIIISAPKSILWGFQKNHCFVITCTLDAHILNNYFYGFHTSWFAKTPECSL